MNRRTRFYIWLVNRGRIWLAGVMHGDTCPAWCQAHSVPSDYHLEAR